MGNWWFGPSREDVPSIPPGPGSPEYGSIVSNITDKILSSFGIKPEQVEKVKSIIDMVQIVDKGTYQEIVVDLKKITIRIEK